MADKKIAVLTPFIDCEVGENQLLYGVECEHQVINEGSDNEVHLMVATIDSKEADVMIKAKRAQPHSEAIKA